MHSFINNVGPFSITPSFCLPWPFTTLFDIPLLAVLFLNHRDGEEEVGPVTKQSYQGPVEYLKAKLESELQVKHTVNPLTSLSLEYFESITHSPESLSPRGATVHPKAESLSALMDWN